ncbi:MAG: hypothetical protein U0746_09315 [Gemmataceae bacterium]
MTDPARQLNQVKTVLFAEIVSVRIHPALRGSRPRHRWPRVGHGRVHPQRLRRPERLAGHAAGRVRFVGCQCDAGEDRGPSADGASSGVAVDLATDIGGSSISGAGGSAMSCGLVLPAARANFALAD